MQFNIGGMRKKIVFLFVFALIGVHGNAEKIDTAYVKRFRSIFSIKTFLLNNNFQYVISPQNNSLFNEKQLKDARVVFAANVPPVTGISVNIRGIGLTYIFKFTNDYLDTAASRIKSGYRKFQFTTYGSRYGLEIAYQDYSRLYFNYKKNGTQIEGHNTDIKVQQFALSNIFIGNRKRFSYNAAFNQNQFQKKSAGSFLMVLGFKYNKIGTSDLIPVDTKSYFQHPDLESNRSYMVVLQPGYAYNMVKNNFYFANALLVGVGFQKQVFSSPSDDLSRFATPLVVRGKSGLGYNGKTFFGGVYANVDYIESSTKALKTEQLQYTYGLFIGVRVIRKTRAEKIQDAKIKIKEKAEDGKEAVQDAKEKTRKLLFDRDE